MLPKLLSKVKQKLTEVSQTVEEKLIKVKPKSYGESLWEAPSNYKGGHYDHFYNFFQAIRGKGKIIQNPTFGLRAAGAALLANKSYFEKKVIKWNPESMIIE